MFFPNFSNCRYRLCLICSDGTTAAEFVLFGRVAQQVVGKTVMSLMENDRIPREIAAIVSQKFIFAVSVSQKSLTQRVVSFQVNGVESFCGRQACTLDIRDYDDVEATKASSFLAMLTPLSNLLHLLGYVCRGRVTHRDECGTFAGTSAHSGVATENLKIHAVIDGLVDNMESEERNPKKERR
ncbi:hypothetical protein SETIT_8G118600v2 [Setaria italica]|uniref:Replication factor A C-terminal domain-containing protein n=1 Tax=Setaria italica TaxID=4555 RepID=A0A368S8F7_SETIT|nr:hypothetical protein SETIT_8G118600v2 [Setaria italica]